MVKTYTFDQILDIFGQKDVPAFTPDSQRSNYYHFFVTAKNLYNETDVLLIASQATDLMVERGVFALDSIEESEAFLYMVENFS